MLLLIKKGTKSNKSSFLQIGCEKGFLLHDLHELNPNIKLYGLETSKYAIENALPSVKQFIKFSSKIELEFSDNFFDFVIAIGTVYSLNLGDAIKCLKEIQRVSKGKSFITLGAYNGEKDKKLFDGKGLFLLVTTKGRKYWRLKYRYNKKEKLLL